MLITFPKPNLSINMITSYMLLYCIRFIILVHLSAIRISNDRSGRIKRDGVSDADSGSPMVSL